MSWLRRLVQASMLVGGLIGAKLWHDTMREPVVRKTTITTTTLPAGAQPVTIAFISDIHVAGPDMPPSRLERIILQINGLQPDAVMIAGDLVSQKRLATRHYSAEQVVAPLGQPIRISPSFPVQFFDTDPGSR